MKPYSKTLQIALAAALFTATLPAAALAAAAQGEAPAAQADAADIQAEAEKARREAEAARAEAREAAARARELAREAGREQQMAERDAMRETDRARLREELRQVHRELREASREIARAHRELALAEDGERRRIEIVNLGDRAVIGVILGSDSKKGVEIVGVTPDGPAEQAGLQAGDLLTAIDGENLQGRQDGARATLLKKMSAVEDGEVVQIAALRDGETLNFSVTAEVREPRAWQSIIRLPEPPDPPGAPNISRGPDAPGAPHIIVERIELPEIDEEALAEQVREISEQVRSMEYRFVTRDGEEYEEIIERIGEAPGSSHNGSHGAAMWFGLPGLRGLELATLNEGLGEYFKASRGVLVIDAREDNAYQLQAGDVVLKVGDDPVDSPSELVRALRELDPGSEFEMRIKRDRRDKLLQLVVPENRWGVQLELPSLRP